jgi:hypothetical protein
VIPSPEVDAFWSVFPAGDKRESRERPRYTAARWLFDPVSANFAKILLGIDGTKPTDLG